MNKKTHRKTNIGKVILPLLLVFAMAFFPIDVEGELFAHGVGDTSDIAFASMDMPSAHGHHSHDANSKNIDASTQSHHSNMPAADDTADEAAPCCNVGGGMCVTLASKYLLVDGAPVHGLVAIAEPLSLRTHVVEILPHPPRI